MSFRIAVALCALLVISLVGCSKQPDPQGTQVPRSNSDTPAPPRSNLTVQTPVAPESYRFDARLNEARVVSGPAADDSKYLAQFDFNAGAAPWNITEGNARSTVVDDALEIETDSPAHCDGPPMRDVSAAKVRKLLIEARVTGCSQFTVAWRDNTEDFVKENETVVGVAPSDGYVTYAINTAMIKRWNMQGQYIGQLRLIVPEHVKMSVRSIRLAQYIDPYAGKSYGQVDDSHMKREVHAIFVRTPSSLEYDVAVMPNARLTTSLLHSEPDPVRFRILVKDGPDERVLAEAQVNRQNDEQPVAVDLSQWMGKNIQIRFEAESDEGGAVALWCNPALARVFPVTEVKRPINVIWYVIDCLRATNVSAYGYQRETTPAIDAVAKEGVRFEKCFSPGTWTIDSVTSYFTGLSPIAHGMFRTHYRIPTSMSVLPELLREAGYSTALFTQNPYLNERHGFVRGFDEAQHFRVRDNKEMRRAFSVDTYGINVAIGEFLREHKETPIFMYVHTIEPHHPYVAPGNMRVFGQREGPGGMTDAYDNCILWADANLGHTIEELKRNGLWNNTLLIVTADHGESLPEFDNGKQGHGLEPFLARVRIPLIMRLPGILPEELVVNENVEGLDITATIFDLLHIERPAQFGGTSVLGLLDGSGKEEFGRRSVFPSGQPDKGQAVVHDDWFFLNIDGASSLYDLRTDPHQQTDRSKEQPDIVRQMLDASREFTVAEGEKAKQYKANIMESVEIDMEERRELEALGYLSGGK